MLPGNCETGRASSWRVGFQCYPQRCTGNAISAASFFLSGAYRGKNKGKRVKVIWAITGHGNHFNGIVLMRYMVLTCKFFPFPFPAPAP